jgi:predicted nuclease of predicted toxin-antitoxin system
VPLRLYADECVDGRVLAGLRRRGVDVVSAQDEGLLSASDQQHIRRASELGRAVVTADQDFLAIVNDLRRRGQPFSGLFYIQHGTSVGDTVRNIADAAEILDPPAMENWVEWIP